MPQKFDYLEGNIYKGNATGHGLEIFTIHGGEGKISMAEGEILSHPRDRLRCMPPARRLPTVPPVAKKQHCRTFTHHPDKAVRQMKGHLRFTLGSGGIRSGGR